MEKLFVLVLFLTLLTCFTGSSPILTEKQAKQLLRSRRQDRPSKPGFPDEPMRGPLTIRSFPGCPRVSLPRTRSAFDKSDENNNGCVFIGTPLHPSPGRGASVECQTHFMDSDIEHMDPDIEHMDSDTEHMDADIEHMDADIEHVDSDVDLPRVCDQQGHCSFLLVKPTANRPLRGYEEEAEAQDNRSCQGHGACDGRGKTQA
ncbi:hypothetical protein GH733_014109 [Mirounga leonina]|nr:hypothetical protein GH733_014109 [Mirounga leonina]